MGRFAASRKVRRRYLGLLGYPKDNVGPAKPLRPWLLSSFDRKKTCRGGEALEGNLIHADTLPSRRWTFGTLLMQHYLFSPSYRTSTYQACQGSHRGDFKPGRIAHAPCQPHHQSRDREDYLGIYDTDAIFSCRRCHAIKAIKAMYLYLPIYYHFYFLGY